MILFIAFLFLILSLIGAISTTACVLYMEDEMEADCQNLQYLILLTRIHTSRLPGLTREDRLTVQQLRAEVERTEAVYRERHRNIYDLDHDSDEDIYHLQYDSHQEDEEEEEEEEVMVVDVVREEPAMLEEELERGRLREVVEVMWETRL